MTEAEMLQIQTMNRFWDRLINLTDSELMIRKTMEMEMGHNLKAVNTEISRRNREL